MLNVRLLPLLFASSLAVACSSDPEPSTADATPRADATTANPDAAPANPDAAPANPDAAGEPDAAAANPDAAGEPDAAGGNPDAAEAADAGGPAAPVWADVYSGVIAANCSCHTNGLASGGIGFPNARAPIADVRTALETMTNAACTGGPFNRVTPGNADQSSLYLKVAGTTCGSRMPLGGAALPAASVDLIRDWINGGAN